MIFYTKDAEDLAKRVGGEAVEVEEREFPDGEVYVRIPQTPHGLATLITRLYPEVNKKLVRLLLILDALSDMGVEGVRLVSPYLPYARQDRKFKQGEPISIKALLYTLRNFGVREVVTVDVHKPWVKDYISTLRLTNVFPRDLYAKYIRERIGKDVVVISPDLGSYWRAKEVGEALGAPYDYVEKFRDRTTGEISLKAREIDVRGRRVVLIDDIVSTGGTLAKVAEMLKRLGALGVDAVVTHCLLVGDAISRLKVLDSIVCTNTVISPFSSIDVSEAILRALA